MIDPKRFLGGWIIFIIDRRAGGTQKKKNQQNRDKKKFIQVSFGELSHFLRGVNLGKHGRQAISEHSVELMPCTVSFSNIHLIPKSM